jgi:hypothetical protein
MVLQRLLTVNALFLSVYKAILRRSALSLANSFSIGFKSPYGDFENVHRCGVLTAESRAGQYKHFDIENAAAHLHGMMEASKDTAAQKRSPAGTRGRTSRAARHSE